MCGRHFSSNEETEDNISVYIHSTEDVRESIFIRPEYTHVFTLMSFQTSMTLFHLWYTETNVYLWHGLYNESQWGPKQPKPY